MAPVAPQWDPSQHHATQKSAPSFVGARDGREELQAPAGLGSRRSDSAAFGRRREVLLVLASRRRGPRAGAAPPPPRGGSAAVPAATCDSTVGGPAVGLRLLINQLFRSSHVCV